MNKIKLNFINNSNDLSNSSIVIFQKNNADPSSELAVAWTVIEQCGQGEHHPFTFPVFTQISSGDAYGNYTAAMEADEGNLYAVTLTASGDTLQIVGSATSPREIQFQNSLNQGAVSANIYRDGKLLATKTNIAPGQKVAFQFNTIIFIGMVSQVQEGEIMNSAILSEINSEINLMGIASADIVLTGGGQNPFNFVLNNIQMA